MGWPHEGPVRSSVRGDDDGRSPCVARDARGIGRAHRLEDEGKPRGLCIAL